MDKLNFTWDLDLRTKISLLLTVSSNLPFCNLQPLARILPPSSSNPPLHLQIKGSLCSLPLLNPELPMVSSNVKAAGQEGAVGSRSEGSSLLWGTEVNVQ